MQDKLQMIVLASFTCVLTGCSDSDQPVSDSVTDDSELESTLPAIETKIARDQTPNGSMLYPPVTYDGQYLAFYSEASNLVPDDNNGHGDIFWVNRTKNSIRRLIMAEDGSEANGPSTYPSVSGTGSHVVFTSNASNLVENDDNGVADVFVVEVASGDIQRISISSGGEEANGESYNYFPAVSSDGQHVIFSSLASNLVDGDTNNTWDVFVRDVHNGVTRRVSTSASEGQANGPSMHAVISGNGKIGAFHSEATNLVSNDENSASDVFARDLTTGDMAIVSSGISGDVGNGKSTRASIDHAGRFIAFSSEADDLVDGDTNQGEDVFVYDVIRREIERASVSSDGDQMEFPIVVPGDELMDRKAVISPDGRFVAFRSDAFNLINNDTNGQVDVFMHDLLTKSTTRISVGSNGAELKGLSEHHSLSWGARIVAFSNERSARQKLPAESGDDAVPISDVYVLDRAKDVGAERVVGGNR